MPIQTENKETHKMREYFPENIMAMSVMQQATSPKIVRKQPRNRGTLFSVRMVR